MFALNIFLLNSANVTLLLCTISDIYAKMDNQDSAGPDIFTNILQGVTLYHLIFVNLQI